MDSMMSWAGIEEEKAERSVWCLCGKAVSVDTSLPLFSYFFRYAARWDRTRTAPL